MLCALVEGRKSVHFSHIDFLVGLQLRNMNVNHLTDKKQRLIAISMLLIPNHAIFIKVNLKKEALKVDARGKNDARVDGKLIFFKRLKFLKISVHLWHLHHLLHAI